MIKIKKVLIYKIELLKILFFNIPRYALEESDTKLIQNAKI